MRTARAPAYAQLDWPGEKAGALDCARSCGRDSGTTTAICQHSTTRSQNAAQLSTILFRNIDQWGTNAPSLDTLQFGSSLDQGHSVARHTITQAHQRVKVLPGKRVGQLGITVFQGLIERHRNVRGNRKCRRRVKLDA